MHTSHRLRRSIFLVLAMMQAAPPGEAFAAPPGKASTARTPAAKAPAAKAPTAKAPAPSSKPPECATADGQVVLLPTETALKCDEAFQHCEGQIQLVARNCTGEFQTFAGIELYEQGRRSLVLEFSPAAIVQPGGTWREGVPWTTPGELEAVVAVHPPGQNDGQSVRATVKVVNKALMAAKAACEKCQGTWGRYGINKQEGCNCRTTDAGKECYDGEECQGYCVFLRYDGEGREEGACSETQRMSGCITIIERGQSKYPPRVPPGVKRPICFD